MSSERTKDLFDRASALPPSERNAFLARECGADDTLRSEVESLLTFDPPPAFLDASVPERLLDELGARSAPRIEGYELLERIGDGGMGSVWRAMRRHDGFALMVAIKVLHRGMDTEALVRRFVREGRILAELDHESIARLLDGGSTDDGRPYLVMEFVAGTPIDEFARLLPLRARLELLARMCDAVAAAHKKGVVHRDLKPANVLVKADGSLKLLDFGIAKLLADDDDDGAMTRTGDRLLTPRYAAPEQFAGGRVGTFTDVWALGVMLHELATGRPLFPPETTLREVETSVLDGTLPPPSHCVARARRRELAGDIDVIVLRALAIDPARRYPSAEALADDLRRHLANQTIAARRDTVTYRLTKFVRRHRSLVAGGIATILALSVGLGLALGAYGHAEHARAEAEFSASVASVAAAQGALQRGDGPTARSLLATVPEPLREFEWHHVAERLDTSTRTFQVVDDPSEVPYHPYDFSVSVRFHPDGRRIVATSDAGLRVWDAATGQLLAAAPCRKEVGSRPFVFGPDGDTFAWVSGRGVEVWSLDPLQHLASHNLSAAPRPIAADAAGARFAIGLTSGELVVIEPVTGKRLGSFEFADQINSVVFVPDHDALILTAGTALVHLDLVTGKRRTVLELPEPATRALAHHPQRPLVAVGLDTTIWLVDTASGQVRTTPPGSPGAVAFAPDGEYLAAALGYNGLHVFRVVDLQPVLQASTPGRQITCVSFDPSGHRLVCGMRDLTVRLYDLDLPAPFASRVVHRLNCNWVGPSRDGRWLASHSRDRIPRIYDARTLEQIGVLLEPRFRHLCFTPESQLLGAPFDADGDEWRLAVFELPELRVRRRLSIPMQPNSLEFSPAGEALFVGSAQQRLARVSWPDGTVVWSGPHHHDYWTISRDGRRLALARGRDVTFVDTLRGERIGGTNEPAPGAVRALVFFAADTRLATVGLDGFLCVFDVATGDKLVQRTAHGHGVQDIEASADGRRLLTAGRDGMVKLWDPERCVEVFSERVHVGWARAKFDIDGRRILFATSSGRLGYLARDSSLPLLPTLEAARAVRPQVDRLVAHLEAVHGDDTEAALAALAALPDVPEEARRQVGNRMRCLPGEPRWLLARAWRTALDPAADQVEANRAQACLSAARGIERGVLRVHAGMLHFRRGNTREAVTELMGGDFSGLEPRLQQARCVFLVLTLVAREKTKHVPDLRAELQRSVELHDRLLPEYWFAAAEAAAARRRR